MLLLNIPIDQLNPHTKKWYPRFLRLAEHIAQWSKDPSTKVGAVIVDPDMRIVSTGFNGFPRGVDDDESLYNDRELKYERIIHADMNAILFAGVNLRGCLMFTYPFLPCARCMTCIIQSGITNIISVHDTWDRWKDSNEIAIQMAEEANLQIMTLSI